jgi:L-methionine (R)-S-oxide reductase
VVARALRVAELIRTHTARRWVGIYRIDDGEMHNLVWSGPSAPAHLSFSVGFGLTGAAIEFAATVISNDVSDDSRYLTNQPSTGSEMIVPVLVGPRVVGTLEVEAAETGVFDDSDQVLFEALAAALVEIPV